MNQTVFRRAASTFFLALLTYPISGWHFSGEPKPFHNDQKDPARNWSRFKTRNWTTRL